MHLMETAVLRLIDVRQGFHDPMWGSRNNRGAEDNIASLLNAWRQSGRPIVHIQHLSQNEASVFYPGRPRVEFQEIARPAGSEPVFTRQVNSGFIGTGLEDRLRAHGYRTLVIAGLTTGHCVSTATRMAGNPGFDRYVVDDETATYDRIDHAGRRFSAEEVHRIRLDSPHEKFATVVSTAGVLSGITDPSAG